MIKFYLKKALLEKLTTRHTKSGEEIYTFVMYDTPENEFSDYAIKEDAPKGESRLFDYIGNGKIIVKTN